MQLSVAYTFEPGILSALSAFPEVTEVYGKMHEDIIGGGRWSCTLRKIKPQNLKTHVQEAHKHSISFNYLLNSADLNGLEQTRNGQKKIRAFLDFLSDIDIDSVTVASPYLLRLIRTQYSSLKTRIGAFARIASPLEARQWEDLGADTLVVSAIACNRNFKVLDSIRKAVSCNLELIANASCLQQCIYEPTHMKLLSRSSQKSDPLKGFFLDYCFLHCSYRKWQNPVNFIRSCWIRPEDLSHYEALGYTQFKIVERSCPGDLLLKRVKAYAQRSFDGNLLQLVAPVAQIRKSQGAPRELRWRMLRTMVRPDKIKIKALRQIQEYIKLILIEDFSSTAPIYIDNKALNGFLDIIKNSRCSSDMACSECTCCPKVASEVVQINQDYRKRVLSLAKELQHGLDTSTHWLTNRTGNRRNNGKD